MTKSTSHTTLLQPGSDVMWISLQFFQHVFYRSHILYIYLWIFAWKDLTSLPVCLPAPPPHVLIKHRFHCNFYFSANQMPLCFQCGWSRWWLFLHRPGSRDANRLLASGQNGRSPQHVSGTEVPVRQAERRLLNHTTCAGKEGRVFLCDDWVFKIKDLHLAVFTVDLCWSKGLSPLTPTALLSSFTSCPSTSPHPADHKHTFSFSQSSCHIGSSLSQPITLHHKLVAKTWDHSQNRNISVCMHVCVCTLSRQPHSDTHSPVSGWCGTAN